MRNISLLAGLVLLASQVTSPLGNVADAAKVSTEAAPSYEVSLQTNTPDAVVVTAKTPNYDTDVLEPLRAAQAKAAAEAAAAKAAAKRRTVHVAVKAPVFSGSHADWMAAAGIASADFGYVDYIISHESGWSYTKWNYRGSGAYGLGQALPATKMAAYGSDYMTDPVTQLKWASAYAHARYGSWANAYAHWLSYHSW